MAETSQTEDARCAQGESEEDTKAARHSSCGVDGQDAALRRFVAPESGTVTGWHPKDSL